VIEVGAPSRGPRDVAVTGAPAGTVAAFYIPAQALPTVEYKIVSVQVRGQYQLDAASSIGAMYMYGHLTSTDWAYAGMQYGTGTNYLPTNEVSPNYNVHVIGFAYSYRFR